MTIVPFIKNQFYNMCKRVKCVHSKGPLCASLPRETENFMIFYNNQGDVRGKNQDIKIGKKQILFISTRSVKFLQNRVELAALHMYISNESRKVFSSTQSNMSEILRFRYLA